MFIDTTNDARLLGRSAFDGLGAVTPGAATRGQFCHHVALPMRDRVVTTAALSFPGPSVWSPPS